MILDGSYVAIIIAIGTPALLGLMLLPTILELRKPSDAGPRLIMPDFSALTGLPRSAASIADIEERHELNLALIPVIAEVVNVLTSVEP